MVYIEKNMYVDAHFFKGIVQGLSMMFLVIGDTDKMRKDGVTLQSGAQCRIRKVGRPKSALSPYR